MGHMSRTPSTTRLARRLITILSLVAILMGSSLSTGLGAQPDGATPFGLAANGVIPFEDGGDIYLGDPVTGESRLFLDGPETDVGPEFSPDGTLLGFIRSTPSGDDLYVIGADGAGLQRVTDEPIRDLRWATWAPDSRHFAVIRPVDGVVRLELLDVAGDTLPKVLVDGGVDGLEPDQLAFRPPEGGEIVFRATSTANGRMGLFAVDADGTNLRTLIEPTVDPGLGLDLSMLTYTADGTRILYTHYVDDMNMQLWSIGADGTDPHQFTHDPSLPPGSGWEGQGAVSPDGRWVAFWRVGETGRIAVVAADGSGPVVGTGPEYASQTVGFTWSPDSRSLLAIPNDGPDRRPLLLDPAGGPWTTLEWDAQPGPTWQRLPVGS